MKLPIVNIYIKDLLNFKDSTRSDRAKKNIIILFVMHLFNFFSIMALVPITIKYLGNIEYGIWLTLASLLSWLINLDFGIGNGLRNKLAEALALSDIKLARIYISTAYSVFSIGILSAITIYFFIHSLLNWADLLNAPSGYIELLNTLVFYVIILFLAQFLLKLITSILNADQRPALNGALSLVVNSVTLLVAYLLSIYFEPSLMLFGLLSSSIPVLVYLLASFFLFKGRYKNISPSFRAIDFEYSASLVKLGMQFFIIQISSLIVFTTGNIIIAQLYGPKSVVTYNVAYKYFLMVALVFNVVLAPFWSAFTESYVKKEYDWIKNAIKKLVFIWILLSVITVIMVLASNFVYEIWVGPQIQVPFSLSVASGIFVIIANWNNIFGSFINGVGKVRIQFYYSIFAAVINIPLAIFLAKYAGFGITGIMVATNICLVIASIIFPVQYLGLINGNAKGNWNK